MFRAPTLPFALALAALAASAGCGNTVYEPLSAQAFRDERERASPDELVQRLRREIEWIASVHGRPADHVEDWWVDAAGFHVIERVPPGVEQSPEGGGDRPGGQYRQIDVPFADVRVIREYFDHPGYDIRLRIFLSEQPSTAPVPMGRAVTGSVLSFVVAGPGRDAVVRSLDLLCPNLVRGASKRDVTD